MSFKIVKRKGYDQAEVDLFIKSLRLEYESKLAEQRARIVALKKENDELSVRVEDARAQSDLIQRTLVAAQAKAEEIEAAAQKKYRMELDSLRLFHAKWLAYYERILERYPVDDNLVAAARFNGDMERILGAVSPQSPAALPKLPPVARTDAEVVRAAIATAKGAPEKRDAPASPEEQFRKEAERLTRGEDAANAAVTDFSATLPDGMKAHLNNAAVKARTGTDYAALSSAPKSESGFDIDEALNPTQDLEDILKDLLGDE
ncbi:MAG: DivIVA domain-containing protein [Clostridiales bacterium]|jgi:hypothetical protein|nr:DivIVA domain-containing protein [Clostridiales bacterium]